MQAVGILEDAGRWRSARPDGRPVFNEGFTMTRGYSRLTRHISGRGADAWTVHSRAQAAQARGEDVVVLSVGDPDLDTPAVIADAAVEAIRNGDTHYTPVIGRSGLRQAIANRQSRLTGQRVEAVHAASASGAQNALFMALSCLLSPGDRAVVLEPAYVTYPASVEQTGAIADYAEMPAANGFRLDVTAVEAAIRPETRVILLAHPNNPTGVALHREELQAIYDLAVRHDLWILSDEVYGDLVFSGTFVPMGALEATPDRVVTVGSLSKSHAMTGWRCGWVIGPETLIEHVERLALAMLYGLPGFVQSAAEVALDHAVDVPKEMAEIYRRRCDLAIAALEGAPGLAARRPDGGMFMMVDIRGTGLSGPAFVHRLFEETGVSVLDGGAFGPPAEGFVRLSFAMSEARVAEGCRRMRAFAERLAAGPAAQAMELQPPRTG